MDHYYCTKAMFACGVLRDFSLNVLVNCVLNKRKSVVQFGNKRMSSLTSTEQTSFVPIYTVSIKHGLRTGYKTELGIKRGLKITDWV